MKSTLPNNDELSIRYAMQELDPSEEIMVEEAMLNDDNLLIEIESLRRTNKRLEDLPKYDAPPALLDSVMEKVASYEAKPAKNVRYLTFRRVTYAAAATVLISAGVGWYGMGESDIVTPASANQVPVLAQEPEQSSPWIDNRDVLHFNTAGIGASTVADSNANKLRPIDGQVNTARTPRQVQLTGSQQ
ncbi:MAG: hypothetical protein LAT57_06680 [Balneolales bacterium]|nr:hypothetical protein [Balneolales bacterium]